MATGFKTIGTSTRGDSADIACDITRSDSVDHVIAKVKPDAVVLAAGVASVSDSWQEPDKAFRANTAGVFQVLESMQRLAPGAHLVFASSASVYGAPESPDELPYSEATPSRPSSPYAASKAAAEVLCAQFVRQYGMDVTIARIFNQIGPGQSDAQAPAEFSRKIATAEKEGKTQLDLLVGDPSIERDFTDVRDTARAVSRLIENHSTGTFNVSSGTGTSLKTIVDLLADNTAVDITVKINPDHHRRADIPLVCGSAGKLREEIGWQPETPIARSLAELLTDWRTRV